RLPRRRPVRRRGGGGTVDRDRRRAHLERRREKDMSIRRVDRGKNHWYVDADSGDRVPGVTSITDGGLPKKALINWAGNATAEYAVDHWAELSELAPSARLKRLQGGRYEAKDAAANKGTRVHALEIGRASCRETKEIHEVNGVCI